MPMRNLIRGLAAAGVLVALFSFFEKSAPDYQQSLKGAWSRQSGDTTELLLFTDGYLSHTGYLQQGRRFLFTKGGPFREGQGSLQVQWEFDTQKPDNVGTTASVPFNPKQGVFQISMLEGAASAKNGWKVLDNGSGALSGNWHITQRMQEGKLETIHQTGTRKTVKLLTGSMFQWVAIDPGVKGFYGTGGGRYTFEAGKYTEHIQFFSRDSSRVGASLQFNGKVENGDWHHSGKSSKGDDIYEVWSRKK